MPLQDVQCTTLVPLRKEMGFSENSQMALQMAEEAEICRQFTQMRKRMAERGLGEVSTAMEPSSEVQQPTQGPQQFILQGVSQPDPPSIFLPDEISDARMHVPSALEECSRNIQEFFQKSQDLQRKCRSSDAEPTLRLMGQEEEQYPPCALLKSPGQSCTHPSNFSQVFPIPRHQEFNLGQKLRTSKRFSRWDSPRKILKDP